MHQEGKAESAKADNLFFLTGIATSYFDFLTYPLAGAGILLVLYVNLYSGEVQGRQIRSCIGKMALWCTGYAGMWCGKWLAGTLLLRENFFQNAWEQGKFRISVEDYTRFDVLAKNMQVLIKWPFLPCLVIALYYALKLRKRKKAGWHVDWGRICVYAAVVLFPAIWICAMANHSWEHYWFTYREFAISFFAALSLAAYLESGQAAGV